MGVSAPKCTTAKRLLQGSRLERRLLAETESIPQTSVNELRDARITTPVPPARRLRGFPAERGRLPAGELAATRVRRRLLRPPAAGPAPGAGVPALWHPGGAGGVSRGLARRLRRVGPADRLVPQGQPLSARQALLALLLSGCAIFPLSEADCRPPSWQQRGYDDG